ncbi:hypothetical protein QRO08_07075 [Paracidovorax citrulli]|uniref:Uncharacterized protein n=3 Tax=Paracidovorax citrulli TaxID=80869 RepID=A1TSS8_PARC0|nr:hypothetical protein [Paracidovorax citrulli]ABM34016.1 hypothetical protein Aave_3459 [Paracidovorax citrulli AAC00-1]ATG93538.1 hypothetical protein CQB05_05380 [Paracidovorax citrulli]PVY63454.1 hypothetical protein C8E08_0740 [Paracidovorax citrulli]REG67579.1 hypothetical protein C8E07_0649 [Paracidovorax citrulli]RLJ92139.1 hypothetical protein C8E06_0650 [Paracidovorax citrulli]
MHFSFNQLCGAGTSQRRSHSAQPAATSATRQSHPGRRLDAAGGPAPRGRTFQTDPADSGPPPRRPAPALPQAHRMQSQPAAAQTLVFAPRFLSNGPVEAIVLTPEQDAQLSRADSAATRLERLVSLSLGPAASGRPSAADPEQVGALQRKLGELQEIQARKAQLAEDATQLREAFDAGTSLGIDWNRHKSWERILKARPEERIVQVDEGVANLQHRLGEARHAIGERREAALGKYVF